MSGVYTDIETRLAQIKLQAVLGTPETLSPAADSVDTYDLDIQHTYEQAEVKRDRSFSGSRSSKPINGTMEARLGFQIVGLDPFAAPRIGRILQVCGHAQALAASDVTYNPITNAIPFATFQADHAGERYLVSDLRGIVEEFDFQMGGFAQAKCVVSARCAASDITEAVSPTATYDAIQDPLEIITDTWRVMFGGVELDCYGLNVKTGRNTAITRNSRVQLASNSKHAATFTMRVMRPAYASINLRNLLASGSTAAMLSEIKRTGTTRNVDFTAPTAQITAIKDTEIDQYKGWEIEGKLVAVSANSDYALKLY